MKMKNAAVAIPSKLISPPSDGIGSQHPRATWQITVLANAKLVSYQNTFTPMCGNSVPQQRHVVHQQKCLHSCCCILMTVQILFKVRFHRCQQKNVVAVKLSAFLSLLSFSYNLFGLFLFEENNNQSKHFLNSFTQSHQNTQTKL